MDKMYNTLFSKDIIVIYHGGCTDGTCGAWCFYHWMYTHPQPFADVKVEYFPAFHGSQNMPETLQGRTVVMIDFTYTEENMNKLITEAHYTLVLDHHETAKGRVQNGPKCTTVFDMDRSGCQIAWDVFINQPRPWFVDYIADRDLWTWKLPRSKEVSAALYTLYEHDNIQTYAKLWNDSLFNQELKDQVADKGVVCQRYEQNIVEQLKSTAILMELGEHKVLAASCPWMFRSELGNQLAKDDRCDYALLYTLVPPKYDEEKSEVKPESFSISLRGIAEKGIDLSKIAEKYGGGGHKLACGFGWHGRLMDLIQPISN
jgi:oligoribonuclease NrnB/cAMP/cGMP phosphodiesterase (DHH superfamily)